MTGQTKRKSPRRKRRRVELVASFNIMCSNHRHTVGVTARGQLYLPGHTIKELERELLFKDIGGQPCKCADLLVGWRKGEFPFDVPQNFEMERCVGSDVVSKQARRIQRRAALGRDDARQALRGSIEDYKPDELLAALVEREMQRRRIPVKREGARVRCVDTPEPERYANDPYALRFHVHAQGYLTVHADGTSLKATVPCSRFGDPPVRQMADVLERRRLVYLIKQAEARNLAARKKVLQDDAVRLHREFFSNNSKITLNESTGLFAVTFSFNELTAQAAECLLAVYERVRGDLIRVKNANAARNHHPERYPPAPAG